MVFCFILFIRRSAVVVSQVGKPMLFMFVRQMVVVVFYSSLYVGLVGKKEYKWWNSGLRNSTSGSMPSRMVIIRVIDL